MSDILGPASTANSVTLRPSDSRNFGAVDTWHKDCSSPLVQDGTPITAGLLNGFLAQFRSIWRGNGKLADGVTPVVPESPDDAGVWNSIQRLFQRAQPTYAVDTGTANHLVVSLAPALQEYKAGVTIRVKVKANNTGAADINVNGLGVRAVKNPDGTDLLADDLYANGIAVLTDDGDHWELLARHTDRAGSGGEGGAARYRVPFAVASGTAAAITATYDPATPAPVAGDLFSIQLVADISGATTFKPDGHSAYPVVDMSGNNLTSKFAVTGDRLLFEFDGANFVVLNKFSVNSVGAMTPGGVGALALAHVNFWNYPASGPGPSSGYLYGSTMWTDQQKAGAGNYFAAGGQNAGTTFTGTWRILSRGTMGINFNDPSSVNNDAAAQLPYSIVLAQRIS